MKILFEYIHQFCKNSLLEIVGKLGNKEWAKEKNWWNGRIGKIKWVPSADVFMAIKKCWSQIKYSNATLFLS